MTDPPAFASLEDVVRAPQFPDADLALRAGRHVDRDEAELYRFLDDAEPFLVELYDRFACQLVRRSEGYFFLLPRGDRLGLRHFTIAEMLVGQSLALAYLDPATVAAGGRVTRDQVLARLAGLLGDDTLVAALNPRRRRGHHDARVAEETARTEIGKALRGLASLGFIDLLDDERIRVRAPLLRFADPVRGLDEPGVALERLIAEGEIEPLPFEGGADAPHATTPSGAAQTARSEPRAEPDA